MVDHIKWIITLTKGMGLRFWVYKNCADKDKCTDKVRLKPVNNLNEFRLHGLKAMTTVLLSKLLVKRWKNKIQTIYPREKCWT